MMNLNQTLKAKDFPESNPDEVTQFVKICAEFSENSSIHGMKQLAKEKRSPVERICWALLILLGLFGSIVGIIIVWKHWSNSPTIIVLDEDQTMGDVPFPGVTVCTDLRVEGTGLQGVRTQPGFSEGIQDLFNDLHTSAVVPTLVDASSVFISLMDPDATLYKFQFERIFAYPEINQKDIAQVLALGVPQCNNIILDCVWRGKHHSNCMELFKVRLTDSGYCCSFNTKLPDEVINVPQLVDLDTVQNETKIGNPFVSNTIFESFVNAENGIGPFAAGKDLDYYNTYYDDPDMDYFLFTFEYGSNDVLDYSHPWPIRDDLEEFRHEIEECQAQLKALQKANPKATKKELQFRMSYVIEDDDGVKIITGNEILFSIDDLTCFNYYDITNSTIRQQYQECNAQLAAVFAANPKLKRHHLSFQDVYAMKQGDHIINIKADDVLFDIGQVDCRHFTFPFFGSYGDGGYYQYGSPSYYYHYTPPGADDHNTNYPLQYSVPRKDNKETRVSNIQEVESPFAKCVSQLKRMYQANLQVPRKDLFNQTEYRIRTKAYGNIVILPKENVLFNPESLTCPQPISSQNDQMNDDGQIDSSASHQSRKLQASDYYYVPDPGSNEDYSELPFNELRLVIHRGILPDLSNIYGEGFDFVTLPTWEHARISIHAPDEIPQMQGGSSFALIRGQDHEFRVGAKITHASGPLMSSAFESRHCVLDSDTEEDLKPFGVSKYGLKRYSTSGCLLGCWATKASEICDIPVPFFPLYEGVRPGPEEDLQSAYLCLNANKTQIFSLLVEGLREVCHCPPACEETLYDLELRESAIDANKEIFSDLEESNPRFQTFGDLDRDARSLRIANLIKFVNQRYDRLKEDLSIVRIAMEPSKVEKRIRRKVLTLWEILGIIGGLAALFLGFSVMACCEMIYYFAFRMMIKLKKPKKAQVKIIMP